MRYVLLLASSPLLLLYSAEARAYGLLSLECLALFLLTVRGGEAPRRLVAIALISAAALYTHYLAIFAVGAVALVAAAEKRGRSAAAVLAGGVPFLFWVPVMAAQPRDAVAWMHEPPSELVTGILSSFGGAGDIPHPFGPPLPLPLVAAAAAIALATAVSLARLWRKDADVRRACAFLVLFFGAVVFASFSRPIAFAGRTEMAVLPVWLWVLCRAGDQSPAVRITSLAIVLAATMSSAMLLASRWSPTASDRALAYVEATARPGDALVAGAHFYLPALLEVDRDRLRIPVHPFPLEQSSHPGWSRSIRLRPEDIAGLKDLLDRTAPNARVFLQLPPSYATALERLLLWKGVTREIARAPEMVLLVWSRPSGSSRGR